MANVFVTGASGMIGVALCEKLLAKGHMVYAVDAKPHPLDGTNNNFGFVLCEVSDTSTVQGFLKSQPIDTVVHLACTVDNDLDNMVTDAEMKKSKIVDKYIYETADRIGVKNMILTSTTMVYGIQKGRDPIREATPEKGTSNYVDMKLTSEKMMLKAFKKSDTVPVIARLAPIYTAEFTDNLRERVFDKKANAGFIFKDGEYGFSFCCMYNYIDFIMGIVAGPKGRYEGIYNIADKRQITAKEIVAYEREHHRIGAVLQRSAPVSVSYNKSKGKVDYRYFDPESTFANWNIDITHASNISTFRWNLTNTK